MLVHSFIHLFYHRQYISFLELHNKLPPVGWQQKFILSQFWRLQVQNQVLVGDHDLSKYSTGESVPFLSFATGVASSPWCSLAYKHITAIFASVVTWDFLCVSTCLWLFSSSSKDTSHIGLGPTLITSFNLITFENTLFPDKVKFTNLKLVL